MDFITIKGARQHNLKNIDLSIPKHKLVVLTGLSGSGKSSLAFDTIYAEGQRRYVESLSSYARQFLGIMHKPDVDSIDGLSPAISIDQKTTSHNPRSTVGTITEIYDYLRLMYARVGHPHCPSCGREISRQSLDQIVDQILELYQSQLVSEPIARVMILSPIVREKKGEFTGLFDTIRKKGYSSVRIDKYFYSLDEDILLLKNNKHTIEVVVDRLSFDRASQKDEDQIAMLRRRVSQAVEAGLELSGGLIEAAIVSDAGFSFPEKPKQLSIHLYSEQFACPECNISLPEIEPRIFSFNSPEGACPACNGLGTLLKIDAHKIIAPDISLSEGAIIPLSKVLSKDTWFTRLVETVVTAHGGSMKTNFRSLPEETKHALLYGTGDLRYSVLGENRFGRETEIQESFPGFVAYLQHKHSQSDSEFMRHEIERFMVKTVCETCQGARLKPEPLSVFVGGKNIAQLTGMAIDECQAFVHTLMTSVFSDKEKEIGTMIVKDVLSRLEFLNSVGLSYLTLSREAGTLAGGEAQRIRLASQIGTGLTGVLYILDEPTIGLHPRDNDRLIATLKRLRDLGNSVLVVEHDHDTMMASDYIVDFGPGAGKHGGVVVAAGEPHDFLKFKTSLTASYLSGKKKVTGKVLPLKAPPSQTLSGSMVLSGCTIHNLKDLTVEFPLNQLVAITGVSGSGKSSLLHDTLYEALLSKLGRISNEKKAFKDLEGAEKVSRVSMIDQAPIGKTPRSNPATYTKIFDLIRQLFANTKDAQVRGYSQGRFSFNVKGGRCEACEGEGQVKIEMQFLPDVYVTCDVCHGARYNQDTLEVRYKGKTISEVLHLTVEEALEFFHSHSQLRVKLQTLSDVGLSYLELGQPAPTLSGGEAQRVKLAKELSIRGSGHTVYLLDEPTTGLHFADVDKLLSVLKTLVAAGNTVIVIEHNLDLIANADHIIDLGPEGGQGGGQIVATGSPRDIASNPLSQTGKYLASHA